MQQNTKGETVAEEKDLEGERHMTWYNDMRRNAARWLDGLRRLSNMYELHAHCEVTNNAEGILKARFKIDGYKEMLNNIIMERTKLLLTAGFVWNDITSQWVRLADRSDKIGLKDYLEQKVFYPNEWECLQLGTCDFAIPNMDQIKDEIHKMERLCDADLWNLAMEFGQYTTSVEVTPVTGFDLDTLEKKLLEMYKTPDFVPANTTVIHPQVRVISSAEANSGDNPMARDIEESSSDSEEMDSEEERQMIDRDPAWIKWNEMTAKMDRDYRERLAAVERKMREKRQAEKEAEKAREEDIRLECQKEIKSPKVEKIKESEENACMADEEYPHLIDPTVRSPPPDPRTPGYWTRVSRCVRQKFSRECKDTSSDDDETEEEDGLYSPHNNVSRGELSDAEWKDAKIRNAWIRLDRFKQEKKKGMFKAAVHTYAFYAQQMVLGWYAKLGWSVFDSYFADFIVILLLLITPIPVWMFFIAYALILTPRVWRMVKYLTLIYHLTIFCCIGLIWMCSWLLGRKVETRTSPISDISKMKNEALPGDAQEQRQNRKDAEGMVWFAKALGACSLFMIPFLGILEAARYAGAAKHLCDATSHMKDLSSAISAFLGGFWNSRS